MRRWRNDGSLSCSRDYTNVTRSYNSDGNLEAYQDNNSGFLFEVNSDGIIWKIKIDSSYFSMYFEDGVDEKDVLEKFGLKKNKNGYIYTNENNGDKVYLDKKGNVLVHKKDNEIVVANAVREFRRCEMYSEALEKADRILAYEEAHNPNAKWIEDQKNGVDFDSLELARADVANSEVGHALEDRTSEVNAVKSAAPKKTRKSFKLFRK